MSDTSPPTSIRKYIMFVVLVGLPCAYFILVWAYWQSEANYAAMKATADNYHAALANLAEALTREVHPANPETLDDFIARIPTRCGLSHTCTLGDLVRVMHEPLVLYLCVAPDRWEGFPAQQLPAP
jgi:hypothetical protein